MNRLWQTLIDFTIDYCEYLPERVPVVRTTPLSNEFLSDYVLTNLPFHYKIDQFDRFPAVNLWKDGEYMRKMMKEHKVTVAVTPDGRADSIVNDRFMLPEERKMLFTDYYDEFVRPLRKEVYYLQKQDNNLIEEFSPIARDVATHVPWATEAFGCQPDAVNIWMGDHRSVTSVHKDNYENIYYVITGYKKFYLYPPVSIGWMPYKKCKKFQWCVEDEKSELPTWSMNDLNEEVEWILPSHQPQTPEQFAMFTHTKSYVVDVFPGEALYIPAMWFHEVHQATKTIAVNYWYDMKYDFKYPFFKLLNNLLKIPFSHQNASVDKQHELEDSLLSDLLEKQTEFVREEMSKKISFHKHVRR